MAPRNNTLSLIEAVLRGLQESLAESATQAATKADDKDVWHVSTLGHSPDDWPVPGATPSITLVTLRARLGPT
jgi:hypothetical protein